MRKSKDIMRMSTITTNMVVIFRRDMLNRIGVQWYVFVLSFGHPFPEQPHTRNLLGNLHGCLSLVASSVEAFDYTMGVFPLGL